MKAFVTTIPLLYGSLSLNEVNKSHLKREFAHKNCQRIFLKSKKSMDRCQGTTSLVDESGFNITRGYDFYAVILEQ